EGLPFGDAGFDVVHQRLLIAALPADQWPRVVLELRRVTRPGGWIELAEGHIRIDGGGPALKALGDWAYALMGSRGIDAGMFRNIGQLLTDAGLVQVQQHAVRLPVGRRYGRLGALMESNHFALYEGFKGPILASGLATPEVYARTLEGASEELARG